MMLGAMSVRHEPSCVSSARRELTLDLDLHGADDETIDDAALVISELMGNAVRHGGAADDGLLDVGWSIRRRDVVISVEDSGTAAPVRRDAGRHEPSGRGLAIVEALTSSWGYEPTRDGKRVWAVVPLRAA